MPNKYGILKFNAVHIHAGNRLQPTILYVNLKQLFLHNIYQK